MTRPGAQSALRRARITPGVWARAAWLAILLAGVPGLTTGEAAGPWSFGPDGRPSLPAGAAIDSLLTAAEAALEADDAWTASWNAALVEYALAASRDGAGAAADGLERAGKRAREIAGQAGPRLHPSQVASIIAWWGITPDRSLLYAHAMAREHRRDDAAAEGLAFLGSYPSHEGADDAARWVESANEPHTFAGGGHQSVYRVAAILPQTGAYDLAGHSVLAGLTLAIAEHNRTAAVPIRVVSYDGAGEPWTTASQGARAIEEGAGILVGAVLDAPTLTLATLARSIGVPLFSPAAPEKRIATVGDVVFQTGLSELEQGRALAEYASRALRIATVAVAMEDDPQAGYLAAGFRDGAREHGMTTVMVRNPSGTRAFAEAVAQLRDAGADALLLPSDPDVAELWAAALRSEKHAIRLLGSEGIDPQNLHTESRPGFEGMTMAGLEYALPESIQETLDAACLAQYGHEADAYVRRGYLTGRIIVLAIGAGNYSPRMVTGSVSSRLVRSPDPDHPSHRFVSWGRAEAQVPILTYRSGQTTRTE